ncbi:hypothetical protein BC567DRAFT_291768 [Phyllosticta citribraziliensis]
MIPLPVKNTRNPPAPTQLSEEELMAAVSKEVASMNANSWWDETPEPESPDHPDPATSIEQVVAPAPAPALTPAQHARKKGYRCTEGQFLFKHKCRCTQIGKADCEYANNLKEYDEARKRFDSLSKVLERLDARGERRDDLGVKVRNYGERVNALSEVLEQVEKEQEDDAREAAAAALLE